jgi:hypothetical protein
VNNPLRSRRKKESVITDTDRCLYYSSFQLELVHHERILDDEARADPKIPIWAYARVKVTLSRCRVSQHHAGCPAELRTNGCCSLRRWIDRQRATCTSSMRRLGSFDIGGRHRYRRR